MVKVLKSTGYLKRALGDSLLASVLAPLVNVTLRVMSKESRRMTKWHYRGEITSGFDRRFDRLWERAAGSYPLIGERTSRFLSWRFARCPYRNYRTFALKNIRSGELLGYIVYYVVDNSLHIADCLAANQLGALSALMAGFIRYARRSGFSRMSIQFFGNDQFKRRLEEWNFVERADRRNVVAYPSPESKAAGAVLEPDNWYFLEADND
jgi:hypothetical protein